MDLKVRYACALKSLMVGECVCVDATLALVPCTGKFDIRAECEAPPAFVARELRKLARPMQVANIR